MVVIALRKTLGRAAGRQKQSNNKQGRGSLCFCPQESSDLKTTWLHGAPGSVMGSQYGRGAEEAPSILAGVPVLGIILPPLCQEPTLCGGWSTTNQSEWGLVLSSQLFIYLLQSSDVPCVCSQEVTQSDNKTLKTISSNQYK